MKNIDYQSATDEVSYNSILDDLYVRVAPTIEQVHVGPLKIISVDGNEPPGGNQYQTAIACLYGLGYMLKMSLKHGQLAQPKGYFDYKVGALGSQWWSDDSDKFDITNPRTLRWKAYLIVPRFVDQSLLERARQLAKAKHPEIPYESVVLEELPEVNALQILHIGPYNTEPATIAQIEGFAAAHGLHVTGRHNELYISDPRRTKPERLKTVISRPITAAT